MSTDRTPGLTRADLDSSTCAEPGCTNNHHHGPLVISGRCHPRSAQIVEYFHGGVVSLRCRTCKRHTLNIRILADHQVLLDQQVPENHSILLRPPCHKNAGSYVTYYDGALRFACGKCKELVGGTFGVKPASEQCEYEDWKRGDQ